MSDTTFPTALDTWTQPNAATGDCLDTVPHDLQHRKANDAIGALQKKLGIDNSTDVTSVDKILKGKQPLIAAATSPGNAATDAPDNSPTNLNVITTLLGSLVGQVNSTNANQNSIADKHNDLATKFNALLAILHNQGLLT